MTEFNPFTPQPPASGGQAPTPPAAEPAEGGKRKRGPRRVPGAAKAAKKPGRPRKVGKAPELAAPYPGTALPPIDLYKVIAAVSTLDPTEAALVADMAKTLAGVTPYQAVRIACALGKLFS